MRISDCSSDVCSSDLNDTRLFNLSRRDADIAFRFGSFDQEDLVLRKVADVTYGLYASQDYLEKRGRPNFDDGSADHAMVLLHEDAGRVCYREWMKQLMPEAQVRTEAHTTELQSLMRISTADYCLKQKINKELIITIASTYTH